MATGFVNSDKDFDQLSAEELLAAEEKVRQTRKALRLRRAVKAAPLVTASTGFVTKYRGTTGIASAVQTYVNAYIKRIEDDGGTFEDAAKDCVTYALVDLLKIN